ncbi:MAG: hypothetical protein RR296_05130 [Clostridia bacterium]
MRAIEVVSVMARQSFFGALAGKEIFTQALVFESGIAGLRGIDEKRGRKSNKTRAVKKFTINIGIMPIAQTISHVL